MLPPSPTPQRSERPPARSVSLLGLLGFLISFGLGLLVFWWWTPLPIDDASTSPPSSAPRSSGPAFDATASAALVQIAAAFSTSVAPTVTPMPPTPTYALSTAIPPETCGPWLPLGSQCQMPPALAPTATPIPDCPVAPKLDCIWRGSLGTPVVPTPAINVGAPLGAS